MIWPLGCGKNNLGVNGLIASDSDSFSQSTAMPMAEIKWPGLSTFLERPIINLNLRQHKISIDLDQTNWWDQKYNLYFPILDIYLLILGYIPYLDSYLSNIYLPTLPINWNINISVEIFAIYNILDSSRKWCSLTSDTNLRRHYSTDQNEINTICS